MQRNNTLQYIRHINRVKKAEKCDTTHAIWANVADDEIEHHLITSKKNLSHKKAIHLNNHV